MNTIRYHLREAYWWVQHRFNPKHRYHVIKFGEPGWHDRDHAMLLCCFKLLEEFLEKEVDSLSNVKIDWEADPQHSHAIRELRSLYFWWKWQRQADIDDRNNLFDKIWKWSKEQKKLNENQIFTNEHINPFLGHLHEHPDYPEYEMLDNHVETIDQKQLKRLIEVRRFMWT